MLLLLQWRVFALEKPIMPEVVINLGWVPLTQYGTPSTEEDSGSYFALFALS